MRCEKGAEWCVMRLSALGYTQIPALGYTVHPYIRVCMVRAYAYNTVLVFPDPGNRVVTVTVTCMYDSACT